MSENIAGVTRDLVVADDLWVVALNLGPLVSEVLLHFDLKEVLADLITPDLWPTRVLNQNSSGLVILNHVAV